MPRFKLPDLKDPQVKYKTTMYFGAAVIAVLFIAAVAIPTFSNPKFCNVCHSQQPDVTAWSKSSHSNVTCYGCHVHPGLMNLIIEKAKAMSGIYYEISGNYELPINGESHYSVELPSEVCERCHNMKNLEVTPQKGMVMNHEVHEENGVSCAICHNRVAHGAMNNQSGAGVKYNFGERKNHAYLNGLSHAGCFRCHTKKESKLLEEKPEWKAPTACDACHNKDWNLPAGHGAGFRSSHGKLANSKGKEYCYECHKKEEFCGECHEATSL